MQDMCVNAALFDTHQPEACTRRVTLHTTLNQSLLSFESSALITFITILASQYGLPSSTTLSASSSVWCHPARHLQKASRRTSAFLYRMLLRLVSRRWFRLSER